MANQIHPNRKSYQALFLETQRSSTMKEDDFFGFSGIISRYSYHNLRSGNSNEGRRATDYKGMIYHLLWGMQGRGMKSFSLILVEDCR